jgi:hypothetical protein
MNQGQVPLDPNPPQAPPAYPSYQQNPYPSSYQTPPQTSVQNTFQPVSNTTVVVSGTGGHTEVNHACHCILCFITGKQDHTVFFKKFKQIIFFFLKKRWFVVSLLGCCMLS